MYDLAIIGGGMAAMAAAIEAGKNNKKVIIIEKNEKLGKKLYATGNGRCNITNSYLDYATCYNSSDDDYISFLENSIGKEPYAEIMKFLADIAVPTKDINGYIYPMSLQASSFVWTLLDKLNEYNVETALKTQITNVTKEHKYFVVQSENDVYKAKNVLIACGGKSYVKLGGTSSGYDLAKNLGHTVKKTRPTLCGLISNSVDERLSGVRANCKVKLVNDGKLIKTETGELQLNDKTLSGIVIFNISSLAGRLIDEGKKVEVTIDFVPEYDTDAIKETFNNNNNRTILAALNTMINDKLAMVILEDLSVSKKTKVNELTNSDISAIISCLKNYKFSIDGLKDYESAQATAGGVSIDEIYDDFSSKLVRNLYFAGEVIDIDGICGGYNITFAILSGLKVGKMI